LAGPMSYAERVPRSSVEVVRIPVLMALAVLMTPLGVAVTWILHARRARPRGFWGVKAMLLLGPAAILLIAGAVRMVPEPRLGQMNVWTESMYAGTLLLPVAAGLASITTMSAWLRGAGRWLRTYALAVSCAAIIVSGYFYSWGMVGFKAWDY